MSSGARDVGVGGHVVLALVRTEPDYGMSWKEQRSKKDYPNTTFGNRISVLIETRTWNYPLLTIIIILYKIEISFYLLLRHAYCSHTGILAVRHRYSNFVPGI